MDNNEKMDKINEVTKGLKSLIDMLGDSEDDEDLAESVAKQACKINIKYEKPEGDGNASVEVQSEGTGFMLTLGFTRILKSFRSAIIKKAGGPFALSMFDYEISEVLKDKLVEDDDDDE